MAISKKGKRSIIVNGRAYLWWVFYEYDQTEFDGIQIKIVAKNQAFHIKYGLQQAPENRYVVIELRHEAGRIHVRCPRFENGQGIITPSGISELIKWCSERPDEYNIRAITHAWDRKNGMLDQQQAASIHHEILEELNKMAAGGAA